MEIFTEDLQPQLLIQILWLVTLEQFQNEVLTRHLCNWQVSTTIIALEYLTADGTKYCTAINSITIKSQLLKIN